MISLRNFTTDDAIEFQRKRSFNISLDEIKAMVAKWEEKEHEGKYFEMFAVIKDKEIVGMISQTRNCQKSYGTCYEYSKKQGIQISVATNPSR